MKSIRWAPPATKNERISYQMCNEWQTQNIMRNGFYKSFTICTYVFFLHWDWCNLFTAFFSSCFSFSSIDIPTIGSFHGECRMHRSFQEIYRFCARWAWPVNSGDDEDGVPTDWLIEWMNEWVNARISCTLNSQAMPAAKWQIYILHGFK